MSYAACGHVCKLCIQYEQHIFVHHHHHPSVCLPTVPQPRRKALSQSAMIQCFQFQFPVFSCFLKVVQQLLISASFSSRQFYFPSTFPPVVFGRRQFLRRMRPIQLAFLLFIVCRIFISPLTLCMGRDSSVGIATRYGLDGPGIESHPASCTMGTGSFPGIKWPERGADHPPLSKHRGHKRVELYLYSPSGPSWPVIGRTDSK